MSNTAENLKVQSRFSDYAVYFDNDFASDLREQFSDESFVIVDANVLELYKGELGPIIPQQRTLVIPATEDNKSIEQCVEFAKQLIKLNIRKKSNLIAIGGGIIQDITAFLASILFRGIEWQFYPTTLLAQADSCIGSKNSININSIKNLLGTFYPPTRIVSSSRFLQTLSEAEIKSGIGEMLHFYLFKGREEANELASCYDELLRERESLQPFIRRSLEIKKSVIEDDELDQEIRNLFNYGHTFGHAIEAVSHYAVPHGQAVTLGMDIANHISLRRGLLSRQDYNWMKRIITLNKPDYKINSHNIDKYQNALLRDKKNADGKLGCILSRGPGRLEKQYLPFDDSLQSDILHYFND